MLRLMPVADPLGTWRCQECTGYLSVPPIMTIANAATCGRCIKRLYPNLPGLRQLQYEEWAQSVIFPCRYDSNGCRELFSWNSGIENHEEQCEFSPLWCPMIGCDHRGMKRDISEHLESYHKGCFLEDNSFKVPCIDDGEDYKCNKLFRKRGKYFILKLRFLNDFAYVNISCLNSSETINAIFYIKTNAEVNPVPCVLPQYAEKLDIDDEYMPYDDLIKIDSRPETICTFIIETNEVASPEFNTKLLSILNCSICYEPARTPIKICKNQHVTCSPCFLKCEQPVCSQCREPVASFGSSVMDGVAQNLFYNCKYEGCQVQLKTSAITLHESFCPKRLEEMQICYFHNEGCKWTGVLSEMPYHMLIHHLERFVMFNRILSVNLSRLNHEILYAEYQGDIFQIKLHYGRTIGLWVFVKQKEYLNSIKSYSYYLQFTSDHGFARTTNINIPLNNDQPDEYQVRVSPTVVREFTSATTLRFTLCISQTEI